MKKLLVSILIILARLTSNAQADEFLGGIDFDSSYTVVGIGKNFQGSDSLPRFWFVLDNPDDMNALRKDWKLKPAPIKFLELHPLDIFVIRNKQRVDVSALIYPLQGKINVNDRWYQFDTMRLTRLHEIHPLKAHSEIRTFATYLKYVAYANSVLNDSMLLFFNALTSPYEGSFTITAAKTNAPGSEILVDFDINKELEYLSPKGTFKASAVLNDSFNLNSPNRVRITVNSAKSLYDKYNKKYREKGPWQPTEIKMELFWRD